MNCIRITWLLILLAPAASALADGDDLATARKLLLGGKYAEAAEIFAPLAEKNPVAALGLARCLRAEGKTDDAVKTLLKVAEDRADLQAELARLAFERGDYQEAKERADKALRLDRDQLLARWIRAELHRVAGRLDEAEQGYRGMVAYYNDHDVDRAESLRWIGLAAARYARWRRLHDQFSFLVNELYADVLELDSRYWPARYEAGLLFLEKYNQSDAGSELSAALELNPNAAEVHAALARLALDNRDVDKARASIDRALQINPRLLAARLLEADLAWVNFQPSEALRLLREEALPLNPLSEKTLGRIAACYLLLDGPAEPDENGRFAKLAGEVGARNSHAGEFYYTLAVQLEARNKQSQSKRYLREAVAKMPRMVGPRSHLAMLSMRSGHEAEARKLLDDAFDVDPFNVRVNNTLQVLEVLDEMQVLQTEHFTIKYDRRDELLVGYIAEHVETIYPELCRKFGYQPPEKPLIEVFSSARGTSGQQWFSTRLIGLPYLGLVAACTGRLVAMASPNDPQSPKEFNWAQVLRHELVHVITLQQTNFNIPHWYTEGLAVYLEDRPRPHRWNQLLLKRVPPDNLFDLATINFAFTRPQSSSDWQMAYCQSELYVEYMLARFGAGRQRRFLAACARGRTMPEAIRHAFGVSVEQFERGYVEHLKKLVGGMPALSWPSDKGFAELRQEHQERAEDAGLAAELAYKYLLRGAADEAGELARGVLKDHPKHQLATYVVARLEVKAGRGQEAITLLKNCVDRDSPQPNALNLLAALQLKAERYDEAASLYALGERLDATNPKWTKALARVCLASGNDEKLAKVLARLVEADTGELTARKKLALLALDRRDYTAAAEWAGQALQIDVADAEAHRRLAEALVGRRDYEKAIEEFEIAIELDPDEPQQRFALADACVQARRIARAREVLAELLKLAPDYPGADVLLESLQENPQP